MWSLNGNWKRQGPALSATCPEGISSERIHLAGLRFAGVDAKMLLPASQEAGARVFGKISLERAQKLWGSGQDWARGGMAMEEGVLGAELGRRSRPRGLEPFLQRPAAPFQQEAGLRASFHHKFAGRSS